MKETFKKSFIKILMISLLGLVVVFSGCTKNVNGKSSLEASLEKGLDFGPEIECKVVKEIYSYDFFTRDKLDERYEICNISSLGVDCKKILIVFKRFSKTYIEKQGVEYIPEETGITCVDWGD